MGRPKTFNLRSLKSRSNIAIAQPLGVHAAAVSWTLARGESPDNSRTLPPELLTPKRRKITELKVTNKGLQGKVAHADHYKHNIECQLKRAQDAKREQKARLALLEPVAVPAHQSNSNPLDTHPPSTPAAGSLFSFVPPQTVDNPFFPPPPAHYTVFNATPQASASAEPSDAVDSDSDSNKRLHYALIRQANRRKMDALRKRVSRYAVKAQENRKLTAALRRAEAEAECGISDYET